MGKGCIKGGRAGPASHLQSLFISVRAAQVPSCGVSTHIGDRETKAEVTADHGTLFSSSFGHYHRALTCHTRLSDEY